MRTPLYEEHVKLKATIVDFAGWDMPVYYTTPMQEHLACREKAALFDICHMGEIFVKGKDAKYAKTQAGSNLWEREWFTKMF